MSKFVRSSFYAVLGEVVMFIGSLLYGLITARALGPSGKGILGVLLATYGIIVTIFSLRFERAVVFYAAAKPDAVANTVTSGILMGASALICFLPVYALLPQSFTFYIFGGVSADLIAVAILYLPGLYLMQLIAGLLAGQRKFELRLAFLSIVYFGRVSTGVIGLFVMKLTIHDFILLSGLVEVGLYSGLLLFLFRQNKWTPRVDWAHLREMLRFSSSGVSGILAEMAIVNVPLIVLSVVRGSFDAGLLVVSVMMTNTLAYLANAARVVVLPYVASSSGNFDDTRVLRMLFPVEILMAVALVAVGRQLLGLLYGPQFDGSFFPAVLLIPGVIGSTFYTVLAASIQGRGRPGLASLAALIGSSCAVGFCLLLAPSYGIVGTAIAVSIANIASGTTAVIIYKRLTRCSISSMFFVEPKDVRVLVTTLRTRFNTQ